MSEKHEALPNGERPPEMVDIEAFAFGVGVAHDDEVHTAVKIQQGLDFLGLRFCVYSELTPDQAREFARDLVERAEIVEGTRTAPTGWA